MLEMKRSWMDSTKENKSPGNCISHTPKSLEGQPPKSPTIAGSLGDQELWRSGRDFTRPMMVKAASCCCVFPSAASDSQDASDGSAEV